MVGRNSSMLLMDFCMTVSNTHNWGRHSSSISLVEDAGKYLCDTAAATQTQTHMHTHTLSTDLMARPPSTAEEVTTSLLDDTHSLQLFTRAFKMCSSELQTNKQRVEVRVSKTTCHLSLKEKKRKPRKNIVGVRAIISPLDVVVLRFIFAPKQTTSLQVLNSSEPLQSKEGLNRCREQGRQQLRFHYS